MRLQGHVPSWHITDPDTANLDRLASVTYNWWFNPFAKRIHARCDDPRHQCPCDVGGMTAYTIDHKPEINFCPRYFTLPTLGDVEKYPLQGRWDWPWYYFNRGQHPCPLIMKSRFH